MAGERIPGGVVQLKLVSEEHGAVFYGTNPLLETDEVIWKRVPLTEKHHPVGRVTPKTQTLSMSYEVTIKGGQVGQGWASTCTIIDGHIRQGKTPPRLTLKVYAPASAPGGGFSRVFTGGDLGAATGTIPGNDKTLTDEVTIMFDKMD